jgi:hypothetical protein
MLPSTFYMQFSPHKNHGDVVDYQPSTHCLLCVVNHDLSSVCQYDHTTTLANYLQCKAQKLKQSNKIKT